MCPAAERVTSVSSPSTQTFAYVLSRKPRTARFSSLTRKTRSRGSAFSSCTRLNSGSSSSFGLRTEGDQDSAHRGRCHRRVAEMIDRRDATGLLSSIIAMGQDHIACIGLGANLGDMLATLRSAVRALDAHAHIHVERVARVYDTAPIGPEQPRYLNSALRVRTTLSPYALLDELLAIEKA